MKKHTSALALAVVTAGPCLWAGSDLTGRSG